MKKIISGAAAFIITLSAFAGCTNNTPAETTVSLETTAAANGNVSSAEFSGWDSIDKSTVVASLKSGEAPEAFNITFGDFFGEYRYYLKSYRIDDDMSAADKDTCESYRNDIITYLTFERVFLYVAEKEYGISEATLTAEQKAEIKANSDAALENWKNNYRETVIEKYGSGLSEAEISAKELELINADLAECGLPENVFEKWETNSYIQNLVIEKINADAVVTDAEVDEQYNEYCSMAKDTYENNRAEYESNSMYYGIYIPDGVRLSTHIYIPFSEDDAKAVSDARTAGNSEEAEKLIEAAFTEEIKAKAAEIGQKLADGENFFELQETYSPDTTDEYLILPDSVIYYKEYIDALYSLEKIGDYSEGFVSDNGYYFVMYANDAAINDSMVSEFKDSLKEYLEYVKSNQAQGEKYESWMSRYEYEINYSLLQISNTDTSIE